MSKSCPVFFLLALSLGTASCGLGAPTWFTYMENARVACKHGNFTKSDEWVEKAKTETKKYNMDPPRYRGMSPYSPTSMPGELVTLADMYKKRERYEKAENLCKQAIAISKDPEYTGALADVYEQEGKHEEAEKIFVQILEEAEKSNSGKDKKTYWKAVFSPLRDLASHYVLVGKLPQAEELYTKVIQVTDEASPGANIDYEITALGKVCLRSGEAEKAQKLFERVLAANEHARHTLDKTGRHGASEQLSNLADAYAAQSNYAQAEALYKEALQEPLGFYPFPTKEEIDCRRHYATLLKQVNRPNESTVMEASARNLESALNSKENQNMESWQIPTIYP